MSVCGGEGAPGWREPRRQRDPVGGVHSRARPVQRGSGYTEIRPACGGQRYSEALETQRDSGPIVNVEMKFLRECLSVFEL